MRPSARARTGDFANARDSDRYFYPVDTHLNIEGQAVVSKALIRACLNLDASGVYSFPGGDDGVYFERFSGLKSLGKSPYTGKIQGKKPATKAWWEKLTGTAKCTVKSVAPASVTTVFGGKKVKVILSSPDQLKFQNVSIGFLRAFMMLGSEA